MAWIFRKTKLAIVKQRPRLGGVVSSEKVCSSPLADMQISLSQGVGMAGIGESGHSPKSSVRFPH